MSDSRKKRELVSLWDDPELPQVMVPPWVKKLQAEASKGLEKRLGINQQKSDIDEVFGKVLNLWESVANTAQKNPTDTFLVSHPHSKRLLRNSKKATKKIQTEIPKLQAEIASAPYEEKQKFFKGYASVSDAMTLDPVGTPQWATQGAPIYAVMLCYWQLVDQMTSVTMLHKFLSKPFPGIQRKRVEGICRRIGLKFRGRGHPRKADKS